MQHGKIQASFGSRPKLEKICADVNFFFLKKIGMKVKVIDQSEARRRKWDFGENVYLRNECKRPVADLRRRSE